MSYLDTYQDFSVKAHNCRPAHTRQVLAQLGAHFLGTDQQRDTYFAEEKGKLKLREGTLEHILIHYERLPDARGAQYTRTYRYDVAPSAAAVAAVFASRPVLGVVEKTREIYLLGHIRIHLDTLSSGEQYVEVEAIDKEGCFTQDQLRQQCFAQLALLGIEPEEIVPSGYWK